MMEIYAAGFIATRFCSSPSDAMTMNLMSYKCGFLACSSHLSQIYIVTKGFLDASYYIMSGSKS